MKRCAVIQGNLHIQSTQEENLTQFAVTNLWVIRYSEALLNRAMSLWETRNDCCHYHNLTGVASFRSHSASEKGDGGRGSLDQYIVK